MSAEANRELQRFQGSIAAINSAVIPKGTDADVNARSPAFIDLNEA